MFKNCGKCGKGFKSWEKINGIPRSLRGRKYCLDCVPYGSRSMYRGKEVKKQIDEFGNRILLSKEYVCPECGSFRKQKTRNNVCSSCRCKRIRRLRKKDAVISLGGKCCVCGYDKCLKALDFHHLNSENKIDTISRLMSNKYEEFKKELKKCVLICCRCHAELHDGLISLDQKIFNCSGGETGETQGS